MEQSNCLDIVIWVMRVRISPAADMIPVPGSEEQADLSGEEEDQKSSNSYSRTTAIPPEGTHLEIKKTPLLWYTARKTIPREVYP